tara:strand:+ start:1081 stop:1260 length:180 start_codon:yes stop_codon:yes gene_type:complete
MEKGTKFRVMKDHKEDNRILKEGSIVSLLGFNSNETYYVHDFETFRCFNTPHTILKRMP